MTIEIINGEEWDIVTLPSGYVVKTIKSPITPIVQTKFTKLEFQFRFTFDELVAIETAAATDLGVRVLQNQQAIAEYIDIADENTVLGVMYLVSQGILTHARGLEILTP